MVEDYEVTISSRWNQDFCCPRCGSNNIILSIDEAGYFWLYRCKECGYRGNKGEELGCIRDDKIIV